MTKTQIVSVLLFVFLGQNVFGDEWKSIELEGKFVSRDGNYDSETLISGKAGFKEKRARRNTVDEPQLDFTGKIILSSETEVTVIGVNSTFTLIRLYGGGSRGKRSPNKHILIGLHGQFSIESPLQNPPDVLDVKIQFDLKPLSLTKVAPEPNVKAESRLAFDFKGSLSFKKGNREGTVFLNANVGLDSKKTRMKRMIGKPAILTMNIDGEGSINDPMPDGSRLRAVCGVNGEITIGKVVSPVAATPKDEFRSSTNRNQLNVFLETAGVLTGKIGGKHVFISPFSTGIRTTLEAFRYTREAERNESLFELDYYGTLSTSFFSQKVGFSTNFKFWEISTTRISNEI